APPPALGAPRAPRGPRGPRGGGAGGPPGGGGGGGPPPHAREKLTAFKAPKRVVFVDELPRNASGKILKRQLRDELS
ncbi:hypothetical protein, partial [Streptomyces sp. 7G]|uniref:AMP-binding enzyme n=1 Tax=Streptomyces sp. 7G TaxID=2877241 RepID=UPI0035ABBEAE